MQVPETEVIVTGPGGQELIRTVLKPGDYVMGRSTECDLRFEAGLVSRKHAMLTINFDHALIEDLGSSNGTFINGQAVKECTRLWPNQKIQIGGATIELHRVKTVAPPGVSLAPTTAAVRRILPEEFLRDKKYEIGGVVAQGGMGAILDAKEATIERKVAMKVMLDNYSPDDLTRFIEEAKITGQLEHPNIVPVHELGVDENDQVFYTMKFVRGITLRKILDLMAVGTEATIRKYPLATLLTIFQKVCDAVAFAHSKSVIHRDLKPENFMLGDFGEVLVMDWGLAKLLSRDDTKERPATDALRTAVRSGVREESNFSGTVDGSVMGTPQYMSPEQARGEVDALDARTDIYALGAILFHILYLRPPVAGGDVSEIVEKVRAGKIDWPAAKTPGAKKLSHLPGGNVPESLVAVCRKALALDPSARYSGAAGLQKDLAAYQAGFATSAERAGLGKQIVLLFRRHKALFGVAFAAWLVITLLAVWFIVKITASERRATANEKHALDILVELHGTAPTFAAQAKTLVEAGKLDEALAKLGYAIQIDPKNPAFRFQRARLLQASQRLAEAVAAFRETLALEPGNRSAAQSLALCERLDLENGGAPQLRRELQGELVDVMLREGRAAEAGPLAAELGRGGAAVEATLRARLKEYTAQPGWSPNRVRRLVDGTFEVQLYQLKLGDLSVLRGMPISYLNLAGTDFNNLPQVTSLPLTTLDINSTQVTDLSPLRGLKLDVLRFGGTGITDLEPLRGMQLHKLSMNSVQVTDLSVLAGMPLEELNIQALKIKSLEPLRGMPLRRIDMSGASGDMDMAVLADCRELEEISLSVNSANVESLRALPKLALMRFDGYESSLVPAKQFWAGFKPAMEAVGTIRMALKKAGIKGTSASPVTRLPDGTVDVTLSQSTVENLGFLRGMPVSRLNIYGTKVRDLSPLRGLPLTYLSAFGNDINDLEPLRGMPLTWLSLLNTPATSVAPLRDCPDLEVLSLPRHANDVETLRSLKKLRLISAVVDNQTFLPDKTAEQFWKEYDAKQGKK